MRVCESQKEQLLRDLQETLFTVQDQNSNRPVSCDQCKAKSVIVRNRKEAMRHGHRALRRLSTQGFSEITHRGVKVLLSFR